MTGLLCFLTNGMKKPSFILFSLLFSGVCNFTSGSFPSIPFDIQWIIQGRTIIHDGFFHEFLGFSTIFSHFCPSFRLTKSHFYDNFDELPILLNSTAYLSLESHEKLRILELASLSHKFVNLSLPRFQNRTQPPLNVSELCLNVDSDSRSHSEFLFDDLSKPIVENIYSAQECCQACFQEPLCIGWEFDCSEKQLPECRIKGQILKVRPFYLPEIDTKETCRQGSFLSSPSSLSPLNSRIPLPRFKIFHGPSCGNYNFRIKVLKKDMNTIYIGRYMVEKGIDGIQLGLTVEEHNLLDCAQFMDEIWVPSEWNKQVFLQLSSLFNMRLPPIFVVPETTNFEHHGQLYETTSATSLSSTSVSALDLSESESQSCSSFPQSSHLSVSDSENPESAKQKQFFQFLSIFKWEDRKGWRTLLRAYWSTFTKDDPVVLRLHSYLPHFLSGEKNLTENLRTYAMEFFGQELSDLAAVHLGNPQEEEEEDREATQDSSRRSLLSNKVALLQGTSPMLSREEIKQLYLSSDAFVLPTRGEGWGLPIAEAMALGLPVIVTNYSGVTEYANEFNSFLIPVEIDEKTGRPRVLSDGFVVPSVKALSEIMLAVYRNTTLRAEKGSLARVTMTRDFHPEAIVLAMAERMKELARLRGWSSSG
jgi:glycosyltransferase involved in cell wall biosynthesis